MSRSTSWLAILTAAGLSATAGALSVAIAQYSPWENSPLMRSATNYWAPSPQTSLGQLASDEAIVVDMKGFNINKGGAKSDMSKHVEKLHAREVSDGAVIFRSGNKLFIVDGKEVTNK